MKRQRVIPGEQNDGIGRRAKEQFMRRMAEVKDHGCCEKHHDANDDLRDVSGVDGARDGRARMCFRRGRR